MIKVARVVDVDLKDIFESSKIVLEPGEDADWEKSVVSEFIVNGLNKHTAKMTEHNINLLLSTMALGGGGLNSLLPIEIGESGNNSSVLSGVLGKVMSI